MTQLTHPDIIVGPIHFPVFTAIASRPRALIPGYRKTKPDYVQWEAYDDAPLTTEQARELAAKGRLIMASRHFDDRVECVVKSVRA